MDNKNVWKEALDIDVMDFNEYQVLAMRTNDVKRSDKDNFLNACLGLAGEGAELHELLNTPYHLRNEQWKLDVVKETGDIYWYIALMTTAIDTKMKTIITWGYTAEKASREKYILYIGAICDTIKKSIYQGHDIDSYTIIDGLREIFINISNICYTNTGILPEEVATRNIDKLKKRYPEGFDKDKSINREE